MKHLQLTIFFIFSTTILIAQSTQLKGLVADFRTKEPIENVLISSNDGKQTTTNQKGEFEFMLKSTSTIHFQHPDFKPKKQVLSPSAEFDIGTIYLMPMDDMIDNSIITLGNDELQGDDNESSAYISGLFQASRDVYLNAAAFNFGQAWFKVRGYDARYGQILINGIEMNKFLDGRPQWSNWGGLNDALRNQEFTAGISASEHAFGNLLGSTQINLGATEHEEGSKTSYALANKSYRGRIMSTYSTGLMKNNWAFRVAGSRRFANAGIIEGTPYNALSGLISAEKKWNESHRLAIIAIGAFNRRGKNSPNTQEVYDLKGYGYNPYWGVQEGSIRNARIKEVFEPLLMFTHRFDKEKLKLTTSAAFQKGHISNSRLGFFKANNPDPTYWKYLPSFYLQEDNLSLSQAYLAQQNLLGNGQVDWNNLYETNSNQNASYYLYEDRIEDTQLSLNSNVSLALNSDLILNAGVRFKNLQSNNFAAMKDLLGANGFVDLDPFAETTATSQNDLRNPNRTIGVGDDFQYNYQMNAQNLSLFSQLQGNTKKLDYFLGLNVEKTAYQRNGKYQNGIYPSNSFGKSDKISFSDVSYKGGVTYKFTGRHLLSAKIAQLSNAPPIRNTFANVRVNNDISPDVASEKATSANLNYLFRSSKLQARFTGYYTNIKDAIETSFYFAEGLQGDQADFVSEILTGVEKTHLGAELSLSYQATSTLKIISASSIGQYTYSNNPNLYLQSDVFAGEESNFGKAYLKNYKLSGTAQRAYSIGFEYRDPTYYWFQVNGNLLTNNYLDASPILRTNNFYLDSDGIPFIDPETGSQVTQQNVDELLTQEKFKDLFLLNIVAGKSWKINNYFLGVFASINNVLGATYKTGGFEQSRNANYLELKEDQNLEKPLFGPKYWYNSGTTYFFNIYLRV
jgi:hypothetical protein